MTGGPGPQSQAVVQVNPLIIVEGGSFPYFTREDLSQALNEQGGYNVNDITYLVNFDSGWKQIGEGVFKDLSNIDICTAYAPTQNLTDIFLAPVEITDICKNAFACMNLKGELDFSGWSNLKSIDVSAFTDNSLNGPIVFNNNTSLETIGNYAFYNTGISGGELDFSGLTSLKTIGESAFSKNNLNGQVIFGNCPSLSDIRYLAFSEAGISGGELDFSGLTSLKTIGIGSFEYNNLNGKIIFGNCTSLETIGSNAFYLSGINSGGLDFSGLTSLKTIGEQAFTYNSLNGPIVFNNNTSLETIGNYAFYNTGISGGELDFSGLTSLKTIGNNAFTDNSLNGPVIFNNNTSLETIGECAFENTGISGGSLDFSGMTSLKTIGTSAFNSNNLNGPVIFNNNTSLETIGNFSFFSTGISGGGVNFSGMTSLKTIGEQAFALNNLNGPVIFTDCSQLQTIDARAFEQATIRMNSGNIDFSGLKMLTTISDEAFAGDNQIVQWKFYDNSGLTIGKNVYLGLNDTSSSIGFPEIKWDSNGFVIPNKGEFIWNQILL